MKTKPTGVQRACMERLAAGEVADPVAFPAWQRVFPALEKKGWLGPGRRLTEAGYLALGYDEVRARALSAPLPDVVIERVALPGRVASPPGLIEERAVTATAPLDDDKPRGALPEVIEREAMVVHKTAAGREAQALHERLLAKSREVQAGYMALAGLISEAYRQRVWEYLGYTDPERYFEATVSLHVRTVLALRNIYEGVQRLPEPERPAAITALSEIGRHKATVLAAVLGNSERPWTEWIEVARAASNEKALQEQVSAATGAGRRSPALGRDHGQEFMDLVVAGLHPNHQRRVKAVWVLWNGYLATQAARATPFDPRSGLTAMFTRVETEMAEAGLQVTLDDT